MTPAAEKMLLQLAIAAILPLSFSAALAAIARGPGFLGHPPVVPTDLDSHLRYLSGIFLAMLVGYASCIPDIERKGARLKALVAMTMAGGAARLVSLVAVGAPSSGHLAGLCIELGIAPAMLLWQMRVAHRLGWHG